MFFFVPNMGKQILLKLSESGKSPEPMPCYRNSNKKQQKLAGYLKIYSSWTHISI